MTRFVMSTTAALTLAATTAIAATNVKEIDVEVDLDAIENIQAAQVWTEVGSDLETAIAERLIGQLDDSGARILIDIDEVQLANSFQQAFGVADSVLVGDVNIKEPGIANNERYTLTVQAEQLVAYFPDGTIQGDLTMGSEVYYTAMVNAFADNVVEKLK